MKHILFSNVETHTREVIRGASVAFGMKATGAMLGFLFNFVLARFLGARGTGIYFLVLTITMMCSVVGRMGLDNVLLRFTAANASQNKWDSVQGLYRKGIGLASLVSLVITIVVFLGASKISLGLFKAPNLQNPLYVMALSILPMSLIALHASLLKGLKKIQYAMVLQGFGVPLLGIPLLIVFAKAYGVLGAAIAHVIAAGLIALLGMYLWYRATPQLRRRRGNFSTRLLLSASLPLI